MEEYKEVEQKYDDDGSLRSHTEIKQSITPQSYHSEIVNMVISVIMAIVAVFACSMILIGSMSVLLNMINTEERR